MPRVEQPREIAELKGATRHDPQRYRGEVPKHDLPLGNAPADMTDGQKAAWFEIQSCAIPGVLTYSDRLLLEQMSALLDEFRESRRKFPTTRHSLLLSMLARLGMSPSDRNKLAVEKPKQDENFADLDS